MKAVNKKFDVISRIFLGLIFLTCFTFPLLVPNWHGKLLLLCGVVWILTKPGFFSLGKNYLLFTFFLLFALALLGIIYSSNNSFAYSFVETSIELAFIPLMVFTSHRLLIGVTIRKALIGFSVGVISLNLASLFFISYNLWDPKDLQINLIAANNIIVKIHPAFLSMFISFCIFFIVDQYFPVRKLDRTKLGWVFFGLAVLTVFMIWLNSRAGVLAFSLASLFFIAYRWGGLTRLIGFTGLVVFIVILISIPFSRHRFIDAPRMVLNDEVGINHRDPNIFPIETRIQIYKCNIELLKWPEILYGYGTGDFRDELQECFEANNYDAPLAENMDAHSEYFAQLHRHGIIGLVLFLALLILPFIRALTYKSPLLGAFVILFAVTALFENVFSAQKGVTFFALFCPLLWLFAKQEYETKVANGDMP